MADLVHSPGLGSPVLATCLERTYPCPLVSFCPAHHRAGRGLMVALGPCPVAPMPAEVLQAMWCQSSCHRSVSCFLLKLYALNLQQSEETVDKLPGDSCLA